MSILTGKEIQKQIAKVNIKIKPFKSEQISTNSYDLKLSNKLIRYVDDQIDPSRRNAYEEIVIPSEGYLMKARDFYLGSSVEIVGSKKFVPLIHAKSGIARQGLFVHVTADLVDIGFEGNITFQLYPTRDILVKPNMLIGQVTFWQTIGEIELYDGKYHNSSGPQVSKTYLDFD